MTVFLSEIHASYHMGTIRDFLNDLITNSEGKGSHHKKDLLRGGDLCEIDGHNTAQLGQCYLDPHNLKRAHQNFHREPN